MQSFSTVWCLIMFLLFNKLNYTVFCWLDDNEYFFATTVVGLGPFVINRIFFFTCFWRLHSWVCVKDCCTPRFWLTADLLHLLWYSWWKWRYMIQSLTWNLDWFLLWLGVREPEQGQIWLESLYWVNWMLPSVGNKAGR